MEEMRERYNMDLRRREAKELEEARAGFRTNIDVNINEAKISKSKRDAEEIRREKELTDMELEVRLDSLLGVRKDIRKMLRKVKRESDETRDRDEFIVSKIDKAKGMLRETRERE